MISPGIHMLEHDLGNVDRVEACGSPPGQIPGVFGNTIPTDF
jgi:hypothetical protein